MVPARLRWFRYLMSSRLADWFVKIAVIVSVALSGFSAWQGQKLTACVAEYNNVNNLRSKILTGAADQERAAESRADRAQAALFTSPLAGKPPGTRTRTEQAELIRLFRAYQSALAEQEKERAQADDARRDHPIPDPPSEVCD